jgi:hypothetical protein
MDRGERAKKGVDVDVYDIKLEMDIFVVIVIEGYLFVD